MTREEFAKKWGHERTMNAMGLPVTIPKYDEFLADLDSLSLPPAEGAEEVQPTAYEWHNLKTGHCYVDYVPHLDAKEGYTKIPLYTTLHAQRFAEKMVEERLREELIKYDKYTWGHNDNILAQTDVDEYLERIGR